MLTVVYTGRERVLLCTVVKCVIKWFVTTRYASTVYAVIMCLSVCSSLLVPKVWAKFQWGNPHWGARCRWGRL